MKKYFLFPLIAMLFLTSAPLKAQFTLSGEIREKAQLMDGYKLLRDSTKVPFGLVVQRSRINLDYQKDKLTFALSVQDVRAWGQNSTSDYNNNVGIFEAWAKYNFTDNCSVKFGRQQIKYDDERLICASNWTDWGVTHDLALLQYDNKTTATKVDIGLAMNNDSYSIYYLDLYNVKSYKYMSYLWLNRKFVNNKLDVSLMSLMDVNQRTAQLNHFENRYTIGPNINYKTDKFKVGGTFYYQTGALADGRDVKAMFYSANAAYRFCKHLELMVAYDHYSGTDFSDTTAVKTKSTSFDKLYGSNHTFLGYMDHFLGTNSDITNGAGINDIYARLNITPKVNHNFEITVHSLSLDKEYLPTKLALPVSPLTPIVNKCYQLDKQLAYEFDFVYTYSPSKEINLSLGYCFMRRYNTLEYLNKISQSNSKFPQYAYLMVTFKPIFFTNSTAK